MSHTERPVDEADKLDINRAAQENEELLVPETAQPRQDIHSVHDFKSVSKSK